MYLVRRWRNGLVALVLALTVVFTGGRAEHLGDNLQIALPLAGLGCAAVTGNGGEYFGRFVALWLAVHASKRLSGEAAYNIRPHGGGHGFPSAHTAAATFGASALVHECLRGAPLLNGSVVLAAGFVGASRIDANAHDIWQVLAGALYGLVFERLFRRPGVGRRAVWRLAAPIRRMAGMRRRTEKTS